MRTQAFLMLALLTSPAHGLAQSTDAATSQRILDELKNVRVLLEKLERSQQALVALTRIQMAQSRLDSLEGQRRQLLARERQMERASSFSPQGASPPPSRVLLHVGPDGEAEIADATDEGDVAGGASALESVRAERDAVERAIDSLRQQIAAWEKLSEAALR